MFHDRRWHPYFTHYDITQRNLWEKNRDAMIAQRECLEVVDMSNVGISFTGCDPEIVYFDDTAEIMSQSGVGSVVGVNPYAPGDYIESSDRSVSSERLLCRFGGLLEVLLDDTCMREFYGKRENNGVVRRIIHCSRLFVDWDVQYSQTDLYAYSLYTNEEWTVWDSVSDEAMEFYIRSIRECAYLAKQNGVDRLVLYPMPAYEAMGKDKLEGLVKSLKGFSKIYVPDYFG